MVRAAKPTTAADDADRPIASTAAQQT
jgi:hypothetical protein